MTKKVKPLVTICVIFLFLYIFLAATPLAKELQFIPQWTIPVVLSDIKPEEKNFEDAIPFRFGQNLGYFTKDKQILSYITFPYKAAVSENVWTVYSQDSTSVKLYSPSGTLSGEIKESGFPYLHEDRIFNFLPGGASFSRCSESGEILWRYETYAPITAFSSAECGTAVGLADGNIAVLDNDGKTVLEFAPGGSTYPVILGTALSDSGKYIACVSGQDNQRFTLGINDKGHIKVLYHKFLENQSTKQLLIKFSRNEEYVFYAYNGGIGIVDIPEEKGASINIKGDVLSIKESKDEKIVFILSRDHGTYIVSAIEPFKNYAGSFSFTAGTAFIEVRDNFLFVGKDDTISMLKIVHK